MELMNPKITIQNAQGPSWLVRLELQLGDGQYLDAQVHVPKAETLTTAEVQRRLLDELRRVVAAHEKTLPGS